AYPGGSLVPIRKRKNSSSRSSAILPASSAGAIKRPECGLRSGGTCNSRYPLNANRPACALLSGRVADRGREGCGTTERESGASVLGAASFAIKGQGLAAAAVLFPRGPRRHFSVAYFRMLV